MWDPRRPRAARATAGHGSRSHPASTPSHHQSYLPPARSIGSLLAYRGFMATAPAPALPAYGGACIDGVVRALLERRWDTPAWVPRPAVDARQVVLLTLDGLGWEQLQARA